MKKLIAALLCLVMLLSMLAACAQDPTGDSEDSKPETEANDSGAAEETPEIITLANYRIVYPKNATGSVKSAADSLAAAIAAQGMTVSVYRDDEHDFANAEYEILIGDTNRVASDDYLKDSETNAYTVRAVGHKIVLCGGVDMLTVTAVNEFIEKYVNVVKTGELKIETPINATVDLSVKFLANGASEYSIIYDRNVVYLRDQVKTLQAEVEKAAGVKLSYKYAPQNVSANDKYIVLGCTNIVGADAACATMPLGGWTVYCEGNKLFVLGSNEDSYEKAIAELCKLLKDSKSGNNVTLTRGQSVNGSLYSFLKDLPSGSSYSDMLAKTDNSNAYVAIFSNSSKTAFDDWKKSFENAGYEKFAASEFHGEAANTKNYFVTYTNDKYVVRLQYHEFNTRMYLIVEQKTWKTVMHQTTAPSYTAAGDKYPTMLTQFGISDYLETEASMCYILRVADGSFVIIDSHGGWGDVATRILNILRKQAPDPDNIVISAWFLTHAHGDHHGGFLKFADLAAGIDGITLKSVYYNFPANDAQGEGASGMISSQQSFINAANKFSGVQHIRPHTGDVIHFADVKLQVMYTQVDHLAIEEKFNNSNAMSIVLRLVTADGSTVLFGADQPVGNDSGNWKACEGALYKWYGSFIQSDVVSTFHHGLGGGADNNIYPAVNPSIVLWCQTMYRINLNNLNEVAYNKWFLDNKDIRTLLSDNNVQTLTFKNGTIEIAAYDSYSDYAANRPLTAENQENWRNQIT